MKAICLLAIVLGSSAFAEQKQDKSNSFQTTQQYANEMFAAKQKVTGKVIDVIQIASFTYVQFQQAEKKLWLAANKTEVKKGDQITFENPQSMHNFHSKALNRTFEHIFFVNELTVKP